MAKSGDLKLADSAESAIIQENRPFFVESAISWYIDILLGDNGPLGVWPIPEFSGHFVML